MRLLEPMFEQELAARAKALHHLSDLLGDLHDLDLLRELLSGIDRTSEPGTGVERRALVSTLRLLIDFRALSLRRQAFSLGRRLYAEKPKALERRFACFFEAWRADSKPAFSAPAPVAAALATARSVTTN
jgi:CHAD domain-containing protein